jgi:hypothetical protein
VIVCRARSHSGRAARVLPPADSTNNHIRTVLDEIRKRDKALGQLATRSEAEAALNDCTTLLAIIEELQMIVRFQTGTSRRLRRRTRRRAVRV